MFRLFQIPPPNCFYAHNWEHFYKYSSLGFVQAEKRYLLNQSDQEQRCLAFQKYPFDQVTSLDIVEIYIPSQASL